MNCNTKRIGSNTRNRIQVSDRVIEGPALEQGLVDVRLSSPEQDRIAIGASASDGGCTKRRATTANVFDHHRSNERLHFVRPWTTNISQMRRPEEKARQAGL